MSPSDLGLDPLNMSLIMGVIAPIITAVAVQLDFKRSTKFWVAAGIALILAFVAWWSSSYPANWQLLTTQFAVVFATGQTIYYALKPTGLLEWLEIRTDYEPRHRAEDEEDKP